MAERNQIIRCYPSSLQDNRTRAANLSAWLRGGLLYLLTCMLPLLVSLTALLSLVEGPVRDLLGGELTDLLRWYTRPVQRIWAGLTADYQA